MSKTGRKGQTVESILRAHKCGLARFAKFVLATIVQNRQHKGTTVPHFEMISFWWKYQDYRYVCDMHQTGSSTFRLWGTSNFRFIQKTHSQQDCIGYYRESKTSSRDSEKNINQKRWIDN